MSERAIKAASDFAHFCNGATKSDMEAFAKEISNSHRTIQQSAMTQMMLCVSSWALAGNIGYFDARNEATVKLAAKIAKDNPDNFDHEDDRFLGLPYV